MNLLHHKIGIHILYSHLYTFPFSTDEKNSFNDQSFLGWLSFPFFA